MTRIPRAKTAYLGLSLELYLSTAGKSLEIWRRAFDQWSEKLSGIADVQYRKLCFTDADAAEAAAEISRLDVDAVVISAVSYTPSMLIVPTLKKLGLPVVVWSTQDSAVISDAYAPEDLTNNHTVQGIHDITNILFRWRMKYRIVTGHWQDETTLRRLADVLAAVRAARAAKKIRVLALGGFFAGMGDFEFDPELLRRHWGPVSADIDGREFTDELKHSDEKAVEAARQEDLRRFEVLPSLDPEVHRESIRRKFAVERLLGKYRANAFTMNFTNLLYPGFGQLPFYAINCLMADGIGYAGEGDILRAAAMRQLVELTGEANFSEIYTVDFKRDLFFMSHMQECSIGIARHDRRVVLKQMPFWVRGVPDYTGMFFTAEPGTYTLVCITPDPDGKFRMIAFTGTVPDLPVLETYNRAYWLLRPSRSAAETLDRYSLAGGAHHLSAVRGNRTDELAILADELGFDFVCLDRD